jgi:hypothetical protein
MCPTGSAGELKSSRLDLVVDSQWTRRQRAFRTEKLDAPAAAGGGAPSLLRNNDTGPTALSVAKCVQAHFHQLQMVFVSFILARSSLQLISKLLPGIGHDKSQACL